jgi:hypothetical protein
MGDLACAGLMIGDDAQLHAMHRHFTSLVHVVLGWQSERALSVHAPNPLETRCATM